MRARGLPKNLEVHLKAKYGHDLLLPPLLVVFRVLGTLDM